MASAGTVTLELDANSVKLIRELQKAQKQTKKTSSTMLSDMRNAFNLVGKAASVMAGSVAASFALLTKRGLEATDNLAKTARAVDSSIIGLQGLELVASEAGISMSEVSSAAQMLNRRLGEALSGAGEAADQLERLGLSADTLIKMDADQRFAAIAKAMQSLGMTTAEAGDALANMGIRNQSLINLMIAGEKEIMNGRDRIKEYGLAIDEVDAAKIEAANDAFAFARRLVDSFSTELAINFAPAILAVSRAFTDASKESITFAEVAGKVMDGVAYAAGIVGNVIRGWHLIIAGLRAAFSGLFSFVLGIARNVVLASENMVNAVIDGINRMIFQLNRLPGIDIEFIGLAIFETADKLDGMFKIAEASAESFKNQLYSLAAKPLPSSVISARLDEARWLANQEAQIRVEAAQLRKQELASIEREQTQLVVDTAKDSNDQMTEFANQAARNIQDGFVNFLMNPFEDGLKGMLKSFLKMIQKMIAEVAAAEILKNLFGGMAGSSNSFISSLGNAFGGVRDSGGRGQAGKAYVINPKAGPEVFVPDSAGTFTPNIDEQIGGGGVNLSLTIDARDAGAEARIKDMIMREMVPQIISAAKSDTLNTLRRPRFA